MNRQAFGIHLLHAVMLNLCMDFRQYLTYNEHKVVGVLPADYEEDNITDQGIYMCRVAVGTKLSA